MGRDTLITKLRFKVAPALELFNLDWFHICIGFAKSYVCKNILTWIFCKGKLIINYQWLAHTANTCNWYKNEEQACACLIYALDLRSIYHQSIKSYNQKSYLTLPLIFQHGFKLNFRGFALHKCNSSEKIIYFHKRDIPNDIIIIGLTSYRTSILCKPNYIKIEPNENYSPYYLQIHLRDPGKYQVGSRSP